MEIILLDEIDSTNNYIKKMDNINEYDIIMAKVQTGGKGTRGRKWVSCEGGAWFSFYINMDKNIDIDEYPKLSLITALAVRRVLLRVETLPYMVKWVNDIYLYNRKLGGILLEVDRGKIVVGIGININNVDFGEFKDTGISIKNITNREYNLQEIVVSIVDEFKKIYNEFLCGKWRELLVELKEVEYIK